MKRIKLQALCAAIAVAVALTAMACRGEARTTQQPAGIIQAPVVVAAAPAAAGGTGLANGVFSGVGGGGFGGSIYVAVSIADNTIVAVEITAHNETPRFADPVFEQLIPTVLERQSTNVDTVTGATMTSVALLAAVQDALQKAAR